jgi:putative flippase GtrA
MTTAPRLIGRVRGPLGVQLLRFGVIGVLSTLAYAGLFVLFRQVLNAFTANGLALLLTAVANTAANRRLTFGVQGGDGLAGDHTVGLLAFGTGLLLTSGSLALVHALGDPGHATELAVLTVANGLATLVRFVALRLRLHGPTRRPGREETPGPAAGPTAGTGSASGPGQRQQPAEVLDGCAA